MGGILPTEDTKRREGKAFAATVFEAVSKLTRSMSEGDSTLEILMPSLTLRVSDLVLKRHLVQP